MPHVCVYVCVCMCECFVGVCVCMRVYCMYMYMYIHVCVCVCVCMYVCMCVFCMHFHGCLNPRDLIFKPANARKLAFSTCFVNSHSGITVSTSTITLLTKVVPIFDVYDELAFMKQHQMKNIISLLNCLQTNSCIF